MPTRPELFKTIGSGAIWGSAWLCWASPGTTAAGLELGNLTQGLTLITTGAIIYYTSGDPVVQDDTLQLLGLKGIEAEEVAYSILK